MAVSHTVKRSRNKKSQKKDHRPIDIVGLEIAADLAVAYIKIWAREKAMDSLRSRTPIIVPTKNGYRVGKFTVLPNPNATWRVLNGVGEKVSDFAWKSSAVAYCLLEHIGRYLQSRQIKNLDRQMMKFEIDLIFYKKSMENSAKRNDHRRSEFVYNRYLQAHAQFELARNNLEKSLKSTKYLKVWDPKS